MADKHARVYVLNSRNVSHNVVIGIELDSCDYVEDL